MKRETFIEAEEILKTIEKEEEILKVLRSCLQKNLSLELKEEELLPLLEEYIKMINLLIEKTLEKLIILRKRFDRL